MKIVVRRLIRDEKGQVLVLALILALVGGLIVAPLLAYMGTGLITGEVYERRTDELYAADAGVEDAVWKIQHQVTEVRELSCGGGGKSWSYNASDVNGKSVHVTITSVNVADNVTYSYRVESTATGDGSGTEIEAYVASLHGNFSGVMDHIITIGDDLTDKQLDDLLNDLKKVGLYCREGCEEECEDGCGEVYDYDNIPGGCEGCGVVYNYPDEGWPPADVLAQYYWLDVAGETPYDSDTLDLNGFDEERGPFYRDGELEITNSDNTPATLTLTGTIYITGDTLINPNKDMTIDLNGNTIFVSSNHTKADDGKYALDIGTKCTVLGPGVIIAVGDIYFAPKGDVGSNEEPVFVLSVSGKTLLQPSGDIYGAVAGSVDVDVQPGAEPNITYPPGGFGDLNFPGSSGAKIIYGIASWEVNQQ